MSGLDENGLSYEDEINFENALKGHTQTLSKVESNRVSLTTKNMSMREYEALYIKLIVRKFLEQIKYNMRLIK